MLRVIVVGANSTIGESVVRRMETTNDERLSFTLIGRNQDVLEEVAADQRARGNQVETVVAADLTDLSAQKHVIDMLAKQNVKFDIALVCYGTLPEQKDVMDNPDALKACLATNSSSQILWAASLIALLDSQQKSLLAVVTSVAGMKGRKSNYAYGAAKAAVSTFLEGMRADLDGKVEVLDIRPGMVRTKMTDHMVQHSPLWSDADTVGRIIAARLLERKGGVLFVPGYWRLIMYTIVHLPYFIMRRLSI